MARQLTLAISVEKAQAQEALRDVEASLKRVTDEAIKTGKVTDDQSRKFDTLSKGAANLKDQIKGYTQEQKGANKAAEDGAKSTGLLSSAVLKYASAGAVIAAVKWTADWADRLEELSKATGLSVTMLQKLDIVTKQNGTSIEALSRAFATMMDRVEGGDKSAVKAFEKLGLTFESFKRLKPDDQMEALAIAVMKIENPMQRANVVTDLFGKTGVQLIPTLEKIASGMDDITVASEKNIKAMGQLSDWWETLKSQGAILLVELIGPFITGWQKLALGVEGFTGRLEGLSDMLARMVPQWRLMKEILSYGSGSAGPLPNVGDPGSLGGPSGGGLPSFDDMARIQHEIDAQIQEQIAHTRVLKDQEGERLRIAKEIAAANRETLDTSIAMSRNAVQAAAWSSTYASYGAIRPWTGWEIQGAHGIGNGMSGTMPGQSGLGGGLDPNWRAQMPPSFWRQQLNGMNASQSAWASANFGSAEGWMNSAMGWANAANDIAQTGETSVLRATNQRGRGKRMLAGAAAGAAEGGQYGGPWGAAGGAIVGLLIGAFRNPAFEDIFNRVAKNFGREISEDLSRSIADRAKHEFGGNRQAAEIRSLGSIIGETGLDSGNVGKLTDRLHDAFSMYGTGAFDKKQLEGTLNDSFGYFAQYYDKLGGLADRSFVRIIEMSKEAGVQSASVTQYIAQQVDSAIGGLDTYLSNATVKTQSAASGVAAATVALFDELRKGPGGLREAIEQVGPLVLTLQEQMKAAGFEGNDAFKGMLAYIDSFKVEGVAKATEAVDGLNQAMIAMYNGNMLNAEAFTGMSRAMTDEIESAREAMIAQGQDGDNALRLNASGLQTIWELQQRFHWSVDETTQAMLDQAEAQGLIGEQFMSDSERMANALDRLNDNIQRLVDGMLGVGDAADTMGDQIDQATRPRTVPIEFQTPNGDPWGEQYHPEQHPGGYARGGVVRPRYFAGGGWARGSDTVAAMLTPGEGVLSLRGMRNLARLNEGTLGGGASITVNVSGVVGDPRDVANAVTDQIVKQMRQRGINLRGVAA